MSRWCRRPRTDRRSCNGNPTHGPDLDSGPVAGARRKVWRWRRLSPFGSCLLVLLVAAGTASAAQAADWRGIALPMTDPIHSKLLGISCPSPSLCVAVGETSVVATSTHPGEGASAWHSDRFERGLRRFRAGPRPPEHALLGVLPQRTPLGRHVFRVRAIGLTGLRGPIARDRFRVVQSPNARALP